MNMHAVIGHNKPPSDLEIVAQRLADNEKEIRASIKSLTPAKPIVDEQDAGVVTDMAKSVISIINKVEAIHKSIKAPYLECGRAVDGWQTRLKAELSTIREQYTNVLNVYLADRAAKERARQLEQARVERERAEALAAEAQVHADAGISDTADELLDAAVSSEIMADRIVDKVITATPAQLAKTRSHYGASASQRLVWSGEIENISAIDMNALRSHFTLDQIQLAINKFVREGGRNLDGVRIEQKAQLSVR